MGPLRCQQLKLLGRWYLIRLLDPPLHEFLPSPRELAIKVAVDAAKGDHDPVASRLLAAADNMAEMNPMLGLSTAQITGPLVS